MPDQLSTLKLFVRTVELGSISGAGRTYGLSTTTASRRLQELEAELDVRLLDRTTRAVAATEAGRRLYQRIAPLLPELDAALGEAGEIGRRPVGVLRVLARRSFGLLHVAPALPAFLAAHPGLTVDLTLTETVEIAPGNGIDLVIRLGEPVEKSLTAYRLASAQRLLCASPAYLARAGTPRTPADLAAHACLSYRREREPAVWAFRSPADETASAGRRDALLEVVVDGPLRATSGEVLRQAALAGVGIALLPAWMVGDDIAGGRLLRCLPELDGWPVGFRDEIFAVHRRARRVPPKIRALITHLLARPIETDNAGP